MITNQKTNVLKRIMLAILCGCMVSATALADDQNKSSSSDQSTSSSTSASSERSGVSGTASDNSTSVSSPSYGQSSSSKLQSMNMTAQSFIQDAVIGSLKEVRLGQLAGQKAQNAEVKRFAQRMVQDHTQANQKLMQLAQSKGVSLSGTNMLASQFGTSSSGQWSSTDRTSQGAGARDLDKLSSGKSTSGSQTGTTSGQSSSDTSSTGGTATPSTSGVDQGSSSSSQPSTSTSDTTGGSQSSTSSSHSANPSDTSSQTSKDTTQSSTLGQSSVGGTSSTGQSDNTAGQSSVGSSSQSTLGGTSSSAHTGSTTGQSSIGSTSSSGQLGSTTGQSSIGGTSSSGQLGSTSSTWQQTHGSTSQTPAQEQQMIQHMQTLSGSEFDKSYVRHMVYGHTKAIQKYEQASQQLQDTEVKNFVTQNLPTLREHLTQAQQIARSLGINTQDTSSSSNWQRDQINDREGQPRSGSDAGNLNR